MKSVEEMEHYRCALPCLAAGENLAVAVLPIRAIDGVPSRRAGASAAATKLLEHTHFNQY
jgi:hypothetical protein